jgi:hypothetical protein
MLSATEKNDDELWHQRVWQRRGRKAPEKDLFRRSPYQQMRGYAVVAGIRVTLLLAQL